jgi:hypothetical protein
MIADMQAYVLAVSLASSRTNRPSSLSRVCFEHITSNGRSVVNAFPAWIMLSLAQL